MKNKMFIYILGIILVLVITVSISYAFFSNFTDTLVGNYVVTFGEKYRFTTSGGVSSNVVISALDMVGASYDIVVFEENNDLTITLENMMDTQALNCTFDYYWRWDLTADNYVKPEGAPYEYVISGPFAEVNVPNYNATDFRLGSDSISIAEGNRQNTKTVTINTKFYNLADYDQSYHTAKNYKGGIIVDNIMCS